MIPKGAVSVQACYDRVEEGCLYVEVEIIDHRDGSKKRIPVATVGEYLVEDPVSRRVFKDAMHFILMAFIKTQSPSKIVNLRNSNRN